MGDIVSESSTLVGGPAPLPAGSLPDPPFKIEVEEPSLGNRIKRSISIDDFNGSKSILVPKYARMTEAVPTRVAPFLDH